MKLFTKYNRVNLIATIIIFLISSAAFYFVLHYILVSQVDQDLKIEQHEIEGYVKEHDAIPEPINVRDQSITYHTTDEPLKHRKFTTQNTYDSVEKERSSFRTLLFGLKANGKLYNVTVAKSLEGTDDLTNSILLITLVTVILILAASLIINRVLLRKLWSPFYDTIDRIRGFKLDRSPPLAFPPTPIDEFSIMNQTLEETTRQAQKDYLLLKEFTENASHEMQTPLAIIRSKLDLLIQENLSEEQGKTVQSAYQSIEKLARLNQSLLLLTKIENNQFTDISFVAINQRMKEKLEAFHELWQNQNIAVQTSLGNASVRMNAELADILLNNLLSNATKHNYRNGSISIELSDKQLKVANTSTQAELDQRRLFSRFQKPADGIEQHGMGLSIVKRICDASGFNIYYFFTERQHSFVVSWA